MYCMTLHDNKKSYKYGHKKSITSTNTRNPTNTVTNVYCMTLHDNKYKHKKSYKYGHQCVLYDFTR